MINLIAAIDRGREVTHRVRTMTDQTDDATRRIDAAIIGDETARMGIVVEIITIGQYTQPL